MLVAGGGSLVAGILNDWWRASTQSSEKSIIVRVASYTPSINIQLGKASMYCLILSSCQNRSGGGSVEMMLMATDRQDMNAKPGQVRSVCSHCCD